MTTAAELLVKVSADTAGAERDLRSFGSRLAGGGMLGTAAGTFGGLLGAQLVGGAIRGVTNLGKAGVAAFGNIISNGMDFEAQISRVGALLGSSTEEVVALNDAAMNLGLNPNLKVSATEAAQVMESLAAGGLNATQIMQGGAEAAILMANATGGGFEQAGEIVTDAMTIWGLGAEDLTRVVNGVAGVANQSKMQMNDYALAIAQGGAAAKMAGVPIEDFNASIAAGAAYFSSGSDAGTSFKTMMARLTAPTGEAAAEMKALGVSVFDAQGNMKDLPTIVGEFNQALYGVNARTITSSNLTSDQAERMKYLGTKINSTQRQIADYTSGVAGATLSDEKRAAKLEELNTQLGNAQAEYAGLAAIGGTTATVMAELTDAQRAQAMQTIFGADASRMATAIFGYSEQEFRDLTNTVATGSDALELAKINTDNLKSAWETFTESIDAAKLKIYEGIKEPLKNLVRRVTPIFELMTPTFEWVGQSIGDAISNFMTTQIDPIVALVPVTIKAYNEAGGGEAGVRAAFDTFLEGLPNTFVGDTIYQITFAVAASWEVYNKSGSVMDAVQAFVGQSLGGKVVLNLDDSISFSLPANGPGSFDFEIKKTIDAEGTKTIEVGEIGFNFRSGKPMVAGVDVKSWWAAVGMDALLPWDKGEQGVMDAGPITLDFRAEGADFLTINGLSPGDWLSETSASLAESLSTASTAIGVGAQNLIQFSAEIISFVWNAFPSLAEFGAIVTSFIWSAFPALQQFGAIITSWLWSAGEAVWNFVANIGGLLWNADTVQDFDADITGYDWNTGKVQDFIASIGSFNWVADTTQSFTAIIDGFNWVASKVVDFTANIVGWSGWQQGPGGAAGGGGEVSAQATGTISAPGGYTWVGERGPELVRLPAGARVWNSRDSMAMAGAGGPQVVINVASVQSPIDVEMLANTIRRKLRRGY